MLCGFKWSLLFWRILLLGSWKHKMAYGQPGYYFKEWIPIFYPLLWHLIPSFNKFSFKVRHLAEVLPILPSLKYFRLRILPLVDFFVDNVLMELSLVLCSSWTQMSWRRMRCEQLNPPFWKKEYRVVWCEVVAHQDKVVHTFTWRLWEKELCLATPFKWFGRMIPGFTW